MRACAYDRCPSRMRAEPKTVTAGARDGSTDLEPGAELLGDRGRRARARAPVVRLLEDLPVARRHEERSA